MSDIFWDSADIGKYPLIYAVISKTLYSQMYYYSVSCFLPFFFFILVQGYFSVGKLFSDTWYTCIFV